MRSYNFWRLMFNKVTSRSYNYFLKFSYFVLVEKWIPPTRSETGKKTDGILGVTGHQLGQNSPEASA
jgi:hypothetical protein